MRVMVRARFNTNEINVVRHLLDDKTRECTRDAEDNEEYDCGGQIYIGKEKCRRSEALTIFRRRRVSGDGYERRGQHRKSGSFLSAPRNLCRQLDNSSTICRRSTTK